VVGCSLSFLAMPLVGSLWQLYLLYAVGALFRAWMFYLPIQTLVSRWFLWRRGLALAITNAGFGLGGFVFTPVLVFLIEHWGWRQAFIFSGIVQMAYYVPVTLLVLRERPEETDLQEPQGETVWSRAGRVQAGSYTLGEAVRTPIFWLITLGVLLMYLSMLSFLVHTVPFFRSRGISPEGAAAIMSAITGLYTGIRISFGWMGDRIPTVGLAISTVLLQLVAVAIVLGSTSLPALATFVVLWAVGQANGPLVEPLLISYFFGMRHFGAILGASGLFSTLGQVVGPYFTGWMYDIWSDYKPALLMFIGAYGLSALAFTLVGVLGKHKKNGGDGGESNPSSR